VTDAEDRDAFRARVRDWLASNATPTPGAKFAGEGADPARARAWLERQRAAGFLGMTWPVSAGGQGAPEWRERILREESAAYEETAEDVFGVTFGLAAPALIAHGTAEQQARHLPRMLAGDEVWCQLFSEPNAGSDLGSLRTRAEPNDDGTWTITGQKVWTSGAQFSDYGILLARTDPDRPGPRGISCFILPMHAPGVEVRPLRQLTGDAHFSEVFMTDVVLEEDALLGDVHRGWDVTATVLAAERTLIGVGGGVAVPVAPLIELARARGQADDPSIRDGLAAAVVRERTIKLLADRVAERDRFGETSLVKLAMADHVEQTADLALAMLGPDALLAPAELDRSAASWVRVFLGQWLIRIGGGTAQIQRNIVGERILGLPVEPRPR